MTKLVEVKRGDIWYVDLGDSLGNSVQAGKRPCIVVSNNTCNRHSGVINIVPVTTRTKKALPTHVLLDRQDGLYQTSTALAEQIISIGKEQLIHQMGRCCYDTIKKVDFALMIQSNMNRHTDVVIADIRRELQLREMGIDFELIKPKYKELHEELRMHCELYGRDYNKMVMQHKL